MEGSSKLRSSDRHGKVECKVCGSYMRSDHMKQHMLKHKNLYDLDEDKIRSEIKRRKKLGETREEQEHLINQIADEEGYTIEPPEKHETCTPDINNLEEELLKSNSEYFEIIELGEKIAIIISKGTVREESLTKNYKEALDLYRKQRPRFNNILAYNITNMARTSPSTHRITNRT